MQQRQWGGFHGKGGSPKQLFGHLSDHPDLSNNWTVNQRYGNPHFTNTGTVSPGEIELAHRFLTLEKPTNLIAYSRGGSILCQTLNQHPDTPIGQVIFLAAAWKRFWGEQKLVAPVVKEGLIIHGALDGRVPLKWSVKLSQLTGLPLVILYNLDHIGRLFETPFDQQLPHDGQVAPANLSIDQLPEWSDRLEYNSQQWKDIVKQQQQWVDAHWSAPVVYEHR